MSHIDVGFAVVDLQALAEVVAANCPELEMVAGTTYRTWATERGGLAWDTELPAIYQLQAVHHVQVVQGKDARLLAASKGVELPADLTQLEGTPWGIQQQNQLRKVEEFGEAFRHLEQKVVGRDAVQVIRYKNQATLADVQRGAYEIGVVPHPLRPSAEYLLMTDVWRDEMLRSPGIGGVSRDGSSWGADLKRSYATRATVRHIEQGIRQGQYTSYQQQVLENGSTRFVVEARQ